MDPTKNFDHLDPKLKETYARVMGGTGDATQNSVGQPVAASPVATPPQGDMNQPLNQFNAQPLSPVQNPSMGPNPGTGPTIDSIPTDTSTMLTPPVQAAPGDPAPDMNSPATSSFFSNPSPASTDPSQTPIQTGADNNLSAPITQVTEPAPAPITPYSPD